MSRNCSVKSKKRQVDDESDNSLDLSVSSLSWEEPNSKSDSDSTDTDTHSFKRKNVHLKSSTWRQPTHGKKLKSKVLKGQSSLKASKYGTKSISPSKHLPCYYNQFGICNSFFSSDNSRRVHYRIHLCIRPYYCSFPGCTEKYRAEQRSTIYVHIRKHHFNLPATTREQREMGIKDSRDPDKYIAVDKELLKRCFTNMPHD